MEQMRRAQAHARSGYSPGDALEIVDTVRFNSQQAKHELSDLYETRIRRMGNAGRNGGEYYTPARQSAP